MISLLQCKICLTLALFAAPIALAQSGTWAQISTTFYPGEPLLMTDGSVIVQYMAEQPSGKIEPSGIFYRLTPGLDGNYTDGTWSQLPTMPAPYAPEFYASAVLPDGRVLFEGGEFNGTEGEVDTGLGAIYDPVTNSWTSVNPPGEVDGDGYGGGQNGAAVIGDAQSVVLPDGQFMLGSCCGGDFFALFDASNLSWTPYLGQGKSPTDPFNSEEGWVLLPSGKVLTVELNNPSGADTTAMLYDPATNSWTSTGNIPVSLGNTVCNETGPMVLRPDGTVFSIGGSGTTAIYDSSSGTWTAGPTIGAEMGAADAPGALLPDGNVFFEVSPTAFIKGENCYGTGAWFFEWNGSSLTEVQPSPNASNEASTDDSMLVLPTGQVLFTDVISKGIYIYTPQGTYQSLWQPQITSVASTLYTDGTDNAISGTQFNGLSQAAMFGDDEQMAENFPLVRIKNIASGHVFYCRTHSFSTMAVATGSVTVSAEFDVPADVETGPSDLYVVTNGIPSPPVSVYIDFGPGQQSVIVSPTSLSFTSIDGSSPSKSATLTNDGPGTLGINGEWIDGGGDFSLSSTTCGSSLLQGDSCTATVTFSPGPYCLSSPETGTLYFSDSATSGQQTVSLTGSTSRCLQIIQRPGAAANPTAPAAATGKGGRL